MLFSPPGGYSNLVFSSSATRPATNIGAIITPTTGAFGSWTEILAATTYDSFGILINANSLGVSAASTNTVLDIGIDPAGGTSYTTVIPYLIVGNASNYLALGGGMWYYFPLFIPAGSSIAGRAWGSAVTAFRVQCQLHQAPHNPLAVRRASFVEAIGISNNVGTTLTAGTTADGTWTSLGTTVRPLWFFQLGMQVVSTDTSHTAGIHHVDLAFGDGTTKIPLILDAYGQITGAEIQSYNPIMAGCEYPVPAGSTIYMRAQYSATPDSLRVAAYGAGG